MVEELDPFLEEQIRLMGVTRRRRARSSLAALRRARPRHRGPRHAARPASPGPTPPCLARPPLRPWRACPRGRPRSARAARHRGVFTVLKQLRVFVTGDIGCYTLGALPPLERHAHLRLHGRQHRHGPRHRQGHGGYRRRSRTSAVAVIGDSTFFHSGHHRPHGRHLEPAATPSPSSWTTAPPAMTGGQENPGTGKTLCGDRRALGGPAEAGRGPGRASGSARSTPTTSKRSKRALKEELAADETSVIIAKRPLRAAVQGAERPLDRGRRRSAPAASAACGWAASPSTSPNRRMAEDKPQGGDRPGAVHRLRGLRADVQVRRHRGAPAGADLGDGMTSDPQSSSGTRAASDGVPSDGRQRHRTHGPTNILISGVGGQGVILASYVLSQAAMAEGYDVKQSEVHGMSQRGGSVVSHLRFGEKVWSPLVTQGTADLLLSFEALEALRYVHWLRPGGLLIYNTCGSTRARSPPACRATRRDVQNRIAAAWANTRAVDANALADRGRQRQGRQHGHAGRDLQLPALRGRRHGRPSSRRWCRPRRSRPT